MKQNKTHDKICLYLALISFAVLIICEVYHSAIFGAFEHSSVIRAISTKAIAAIIALCLVVYFDLCSFLKFNLLKNRAGYIAIIPCLIIAINNFPFVPFLAHTLVFDYALLDIVLFALECVAVGLFEELAYRACVFGIILKNRRKTTKDIFVSVIISSLIFGASHLINIVAGASVPGTLLQTGYSFLIGAMCSFVILMTASVWPCVIIHAIYNFCGGVAPRFAYGKIWTAGEVILTAVLSVIVIIYVVIKMSKVRPSDTDRFYS